MKVTKVSQVFFLTFGLTTLVSLVLGFFIAKTSAEYSITAASVKADITSQLGAGGEVSSVNPLEVEEGRSILLLGTDEGGSLVDSIMLIHIVNTTQEVQLVSLPRDLIVFDENNNYAKINSLYSRARQRGESEETSLRFLGKYVSDITGIEIDNHIKINFAGFQEVVDHIGGVTVDVKEAIDDPYFPGPNYSYERFTIEAGIQKLDGATALRYARSRYVSAGGDLDRARRQQQIVQAIQSKLLSMSPVKQVSLIPGLVKIIMDNSVTDLSLNGLLDFYSIYQNTKDYNVSSLVIGQDLLRGPLRENYRMFGRSRGYVLEPRAGAQIYLQIQEEVANASQREMYLTQMRQVVLERARVGVVVDGELTKGIEDQLALFRVHGIAVEVIETRQGTQYEGNAIYVSNPNRLVEIPETNKYLTQTLQATELDGDPRRIDANHLSLNYDILVYIKS